MRITPVYLMLSHACRSTQRLLMLRKAKNYDRDRSTLQSPYKLSGTCIDSLLPCITLFEDAVTETLGQCKTWFQKGLINIPGTCSQKWHSACSNRCIRFTRYIPTCKCSPRTPSSSLYTTGHPRVPGQKCWPNCHHLHRCSRRLVQ